MTNRLDWNLIVPMKSLAMVKSRLHVGSQPVRARLAVAFLKDAVSAAEATGLIARTVVVSPDPVLSTIVNGLHATDRGNGIDDAVDRGCNLLRRLGFRGPTMVMMPDLPCLRSRELSDLLAEAERHRATFVSDESGVGSTIATATELDEVRTGFGTGSAHRHRGFGLTEVAQSLASAKRDVDSPADLQEAIQLGIGRHTATALTDLFGGAEYVPGR